MILCRHLLSHVLTFTFSNFLSYSVDFQRDLFIQTVHLGTSGGGGKMKNDRPAPAVGSVNITAMEGTAMVKDNRACRYGTIYGIRQAKTTGIGYMMNRSVRIFIDFENAMFVRTRYVTHASIFSGGIIQSYPGGDQIIHRLYTKVTLILMDRLGLPARGF